MLGRLRPESDLDLLALSRRRLDDAERPRLLARILAASGVRSVERPGRPIELGVAVHDDVRPWRHPADRDLLYGEWLRRDLEAGDLAPFRHQPSPDMTTLIAIVLMAGVPLLGPPPRDLLDPIPGTDLAQAVTEGVDDLLASLEPDTRNVLLTLARVWYTVETGEIRPKDEAASWAAGQLSGEARGVLELAAAAYRGEAEDDWDARQGQAAAAAAAITARIAADFRLKTCIVLQALPYTCSVAGNLADVAKQAGVSEATVSRVLNDKPGISDATRAAVLTALDVIGYERPTRLRVRRGRMIGLVVPELQNPIFPAIADVVGGALAQRGFNAVLCTRTGGISEAEYVDMLLDRQVSGMVFAGGQYAEADAPHDHYLRLLKLRLPVVLVNAAAEHLQFPRVSTDDAVAMEQAYGHLVSLGHERIGVITGPSDHVPSRRKLEAFADAAAANGDAHDGELVERTMFAVEGGHAAATRLIRQGATGIICASDPLALGAMRAVRRAGLSVPGDVSVVGYDDSPLMNYTDPPCTTVRQPIEAIGRAAVATVASQIEGAEVAAEELFFDPELVARGSTAAAPVRTAAPA